MTVSALDDRPEDEATQSPAISHGQEFMVLKVHDNGWLEAAEGYLWPTWVTPVKESDGGSLIRAYLYKVNGSFGLKVGGWYIDTYSDWKAFSSHLKFLV